MGIAGESGCGKSLTAQSILRIIPKNGRIVSGEIVLNLDGRLIDLIKIDPEGEEIRKIRGKEISMIFQEPSKTIDAYPFNLSGGMRQRAMVAMALSCQPSLLIADEPTTAVDVTIQAQVLELMKELQEERNMGLIMITHDLGVIAELADKVLIMYLGKGVEYASVDEIFYHPKHPYTEGLLASIPRLTMDYKERIESISGIVPSPYEILPGCKFHPRCPKYMPDVCDKKEPPMVEVSEDHQASCFLYSR